VLAHHHAATSDALVAGTLRADHLKILGRAAAAGRGELFDRDEALLLELARQHDVDTFDRLVAAWQLLADEALDKKSPEKTHRARRVHLNDLLDGCGHLEGQVDPETNALLKKAFELLAPPDKADTPEGPRTRAQRQHDALHEMARRVLADHHRRTGKPTANVDVVIDAVHLARQRGNDLATTHDAVTTACTISGLPTYLATAQRLCCDSYIGRVILNGRTELVDLGRRVRTFTPTQRRALEKIYPTCIMPRCPQTSDNCEMHHVEEYDAQQGRTDIDNGAPICWHHHHFAHEYHWQCVRDHHGLWTLVPP
jgi:hypothetical protein